MCSQTGKTSTARLESQGRWVPEKIEQSMGAGWRRKWSNSPSSSFQQESSYISPCLIAVEAKYDQML